MTQADESIPKRLFPLKISFVCSDMKHRLCDMCLSKALIVLCSIGLLTAIHPSASSGQGLGELGDQEAFTHDFRTPGEPSMRVFIWGDVQQSGIWRVNRNVDFIDLLSAARPGGVGLERYRARRYVTVQVFRTQEGNRSKVYERRLENMLERGEDLPELSERDVIQINTRERRTALDQFQRIVSIIGSLASLATLALRFID